jgi:hypothetical protein
MYKAENRFPSGRNEGALKCCSTVTLIEMNSAECEKYRVKTPRQSKAIDESESEAEGKRKNENSI